MIRENFNDQWQVLKEDGNLALNAYMGKAEAKEVHLPYDAMIYEERTPDTPNGAQTGFYPGGRYCYQKTFVAPKEWEEKEVTLEFEGVYQTAEVYINGAFVLRNLYGYSNFYVLLNPWLNYGVENTIKVIADNSMMPNSRWYTGSGIYRDVKLMVGERIHLQTDGLRIQTVMASKESAIVQVETNIKSISCKREKFQVQVNILRKGKCVAQDQQTIVFYPKEKGNTYHSFCIEQPELWSCDSPELYECEVVILSHEEILDKTVEKFGIRTLTIDAKHGVRINGREIKLRGSCIHHDNGILGATTLKKAEERRCRQLKEAGFNSVRSSHHPMSKAFLNACDKYGVLVMDELSDMWTVHKNPYDFASQFETCWEDVVEKMVAKDYNHPCVILYSAGNEIQEAGSEAGAYWNRKICSKFHELDSTRYTTNGLNGLMAAGYRLRPIMKEMAEKFGTSNASKQGNGEGSNALNSFMSLMEGEKGDYFSKHPLLSEALEGCASTCDVIGLNYLTGRHEMEKELHPNKTVVGTETYPADIVRLWSIVKRNPHVLGDFTWTGYDYLGEAGCGIFHYDGTANFSSVYPERTAYIGDIDLIGCRRPISYLREIVYGLRKQPYIAVERVNRYGLEHSKTPWMDKDTIESWTWTGYEGKPARVYVYSDAEEVELFLNGRSLGRKPAGEQNSYTVCYETVYEAGELRAISYRKGKEEESFSLFTANQEVELDLETDGLELKANGEDLAFIMIKLRDKNGVINREIKKKIAVKVKGVGGLMALGNANPSSEERYDSVECETYDGYALAVVRAGKEQGMIQVEVEAESCKTAVVHMKVGGSV